MNRQEMRARLQDLRDRVHTTGVFGAAEGVELIDLFMAGADPESERKPARATPASAKPESVGSTPEAKDDTDTGKK